MNVNSALSLLEQQKVIITSKARELDLEGFEIDDNYKTTFFNADILPEGLKNKNADADG